MKSFLAGWKLILGALCQFLKRLLKIVEVLIELILGRKEPGRDADCFSRPDLRARPDPYIYSQQWLHLRGLAYTWDNPDFTLIDPGTGLAVDNHSLIAGKRYRVRARIHNSSIMAAVATAVRFEVLHFGAGTPVIQALGQVSVDVPALGAVVAEIDWVTPATGGHNCLRATISHPDDANPLNNVGQHNTDVAVPASPTRKLKFSVGNAGRVRRTYELRMNSYRLPSTPLAPGGAERGEPRRSSADARTDPPRQSLAYLARLRAVNDFSKFPVPDFLKARLQHPRMTVEPGQQIETYLEVDPPKPGQGRQVVNVNVLHDGLLVGGVTAYIEEA